MVFVLNPVGVGIDIGKVNDPTAISVAEAVRSPTGKHRQIKRILPHIDHLGYFQPGKDTEPEMRTRFLIRGIQRLKLGLGYPEIAKIIADMLCNDIFVGRELRIFVDVTGVGRPVYEDVRADLDLRNETISRKTSIQWRPITIVAGNTYNRSKGSLGKEFLVSRLQSLLQNDRIDAPNTPEMVATADELRVYEIKVSPDGHAAFGAKTGKHDDLATALGLSCLEDPFGEAVTYSQRVY